MGTLLSSMSPSGMTYLALKAITTSSVSTKWAKLITRENKRNKWATGRRRLTDGWAFSVRREIIEKRERAGDWKGSRLKLEEKK